MREIQFRFSQFSSPESSTIESELRFARSTSFADEAGSETTTIACEIVNAHLTHLFQMMVQFQMGQITLKTFQSHLQTHASGIDEAYEILEIDTPPKRDLYGERSKHSTKWKCGIETNVESQPNPNTLLQMSKV